MRELNADEVQELYTGVSSASVEAIENLNINFFYDYLISGFSKMLKDDLRVLDNKSVDLLLTKVIQRIAVKMAVEDQLSVEESQVFLYALYNDVVRLMDLDKNISKMAFVKRGTLNLPKDCNGIHRLDNNDKSEIYYNIDTFDKFGKNTSLADRLIIARLIPHELVHCIQMDDALNGEINLSAFVVSLEQVMRSISNTYYDDNYSHTKLETDANHRGMLGVWLFLVNRELIDILGFDRKSVLAFAEQFLEEGDDKSRKHIVKHDGKEDIVGRILLDSCEKKVMSNPAIMKRYPLLSCCYGADGRLMGVSQLLERRASLIKNNPEKKNDIDSIYDYIFECSFTDDIDISKILEVAEYFSAGKDTDGYAEKKFMEVATSHGVADSKAREFVKSTKSGK